MDGIHKSHIDYGFADKEATQYIERFEIMGFETHMPSSDHAPMIMTIVLDGITPDSGEEVEDRTSSKTNWEAFTKILEQRSMQEEEVYNTLTVGGQFETLAQNITAAYRSSTTTKKFKTKKTKSKLRKPLTQKLRKIILAKRDCLRALRTKISTNTDYTEELR